jgi:protein-L-isoaspartate(D-aspartate) O-methyltransferase
MVMDLGHVIRRLQERLLASVAEYFLLADATLSERVRDAFLAVPRHGFVPRYRDFGSEAWQEVTDHDLLAHLPVLYRDDGLAIGVDGAGDAVTISSPGWVLYLLELLRVEPGQRVFEVGAGSGWNAALLGHLAGPTGHVESFEIIPALAMQAARAVANAGLTNVRVVAGDAGAGPVDGEPFDRVIFTAGSYDLPGWIHGRVRVGGLLLLSLKLPGGGDCVTLFRRDEDCFVALTARACEVVWMRGQTHDAALDPVQLEDDREWRRLRDRPTGQRRFPFGGRSSAGLAQRTFALRSFLAICEPRMRWFVGAEGWPYYAFGLYDETTDSLVVAQDGVLASFNGVAASDALVARIHEWVDLGMPSAETMEVRAYPAGTVLTAAAGETIVRRRATHFVWRLA